MLPFAKKDVADQMSDIGAARTVPTLVCHDGAVVSESAAIAEELATRHPKAGIWPIDPKARAVARTLLSEMASGFTALRGDCPMSLRVCYADCSPSDAVRTDLARLEEIWAYARTHRVSDGPWLLGDYSAADAFLHLLLAALRVIRCLLMTMPLPMSPRILRTQPFAAGVQWG